MEVSGIQSSFLFSSPFSISGGDPAAAREAEDTLNEAGAARTPVNDLIFDSLVLVTRRTPKLEAAGPVAGFRVGEAVKFLSGRIQSRRLPLVDDIQRKERFTNLKVNRLDRLRESLNTLNTTVNVFLDNGAFNLRAADSVRSERIEVEAGPKAPLVKFTVTPNRKSVNSVRASDRQSEPLGVLGLSGSFFVNGFKISVEATDTLFDLRDKINRGEDLNNNRVLDKAEDLNNNGAIDSFTFGPGEFTPAIFVSEDLDGDGKLDPSEDANNNNRLDGGIEQSRVVASVIDNRLILRSEAGGSTAIDLVDNNGVLLALGFFELNLKGLPILKELQFNEARFPVNLNVNPETASIGVDQTFAEPDTVKSDFDAFTNVAEDAVVTVKRASDRKSGVQIFIDAANTLDQIQTFFDQFNKSIGQINDILGRSREFVRDFDIQNLRNDLTQDTQTRTREIEKRNATLDEFRVAVENRQETGVSVNNTEKQTVQEVSVTTAVKDIRQGILFPFTNAERDLSNRLASIGIRTQEDNSFAIEPTKLKRALEVNAGETVGLFNDPETGILPVLRDRLGQILKAGLGDLDLKRDKVLIQAGAPNVLADRLKQFTENSTLSQTVQTLIAVA